MPCCTRAKLLEYEKSQIQRSEQVPQKTYLGISDRLLVCLPSPPQSLASPPINEMPIIKLISRSFSHSNSQTVCQMNKGDKFLQKLRYCVSRRVQQGNLVLSYELITQFGYRKQFKSLRLERQPFVRANDEGKSASRLVSQTHTQSVGNLIGCYSISESEVSQLA